MKILILANSSSGLCEFRSELILELKKHAEVTAIVPFGDKMDMLRSLGINLIDLPITRRGVNPAEDIGTLRNYRKLLKEASPDLVITYTIKPNIYGGLACRMLGIPYYANITGLGTTFQKDGLLKKLVIRLYKSAFRRVKVVFFENSANKSVFTSAGIVSEDKTYLLNGAGVNLEHFQPTELPDEDTIKFLFIGRVMQEKGVNELFVAMKRLLSDGFRVHLDILGEYEEDYASVIEEYENEGWLTYHGYQTDVRPFIQKAHCFVLPSWHEGMANTNLECAASGRPVITSDIPGCREAVLDGQSGFLCEIKNSESLYEAMKRFILLTHGEKTSLGIAGRKHMEEVFDKNKVVEETLKQLLTEER